MRQCTICKSIYVENIPDDGDTKAIYKNKNYHSELEPDVKKRMIKENKRRMKIISRISDGKSFIDVGCADGLLLDNAKDMGFETYGIEITETNANKAREKGHAIFNCTLKEFVENNDRKFDIVTLLDVIEHVSNPYDFICDLVSLVNNCGLIVISTPNFSGIISRLLKDKNSFFIPPEHLNYFTLKGVSLLVERAGLEIIKNLTFGRLIKREIQTSIDKYIPTPFRFLFFIIKPNLNLIIQSLNLLKSGLELEVYLKKK